MRVNLLVSVSVANFWGMALAFQSLPLHSSSIRWLLFERCRPQTIAFLRINNNEENDEVSWGTTPAESAVSPSTVITFAAQPVVWISLVSVVTTGHGLPEGPFGLLGALEGISYLLVLFGAAVGTSAATKIVSRGTLLLGLAAVVSLVAQQGCVPNAQPILDYSNYLPICQ